MKLSINPRVHLIYVVLDLSVSMKPNLSLLESELDDLMRYLLACPVLSSAVRLSVIGFGGQAKTLIHLKDIAAGFEPLTLSTMLGEKNYLCLFQELALRLGSDVSRLKQEYVLMRPAVIILTDGQSSKNAEWLLERQKLLDTPLRPNIVAIGMDTANKDTILALATKSKQDKLLSFCFRKGILSELFEPEFTNVEIERPIPSGMLPLEEVDLFVSEPVK